jgi:23S rRNA (guanosine2251-2'-O)-methyltransferase
MMKQLAGKALKDFLKSDERPPIEVAFVMQDVADPVNIGAAFRIADACGATEIVLTGLSPIPPHPTIHGVGRGTHRRVPWSYVKDASEALSRLRGEGYACYALEVSSNAVPYNQVDYPAKVCFVAGNEHHGVTNRTLALCNGAIYIPMYGKIRSLNVHVALAIVSYNALHQPRSGAARPPTSTLQPGPSA